MSMYNDIAWEKKEIQKDVKTIHRQLRNILVHSLAIIGLSWGPGQKRNGTEPTPTKRILGQNCRGFDDEFLRFRSSNISCSQCL